MWAPLLLIGVPGLFRFSGLAIRLRIPFSFFRLIRIPQTVAEWIPIGCQIIFLNTNKDSRVQIMIVFLEAGFKSDNRPEPVDTLGISTSSYYFPRPLMGP